MEKMLENINKNFIILYRENYDENTTNIKLLLEKENPSFLALKTSEFLNTIKAFMENNNITQNSKEYRIFNIILKSKLFGIDVIILLN